MFDRLIKSPKKQSFFLFGPRGTGKTTWLKENFRADLTFDLLKSSQYLELKSQPGILADRVRALRPGSRVVIDELQKLPGILDEVHSILFETGDSIQFALTGSSARKLKRSQANLLAGRAVTRSCFPLTLQELKGAIPFDRLLRWGALPRALTLEQPEEKIDYLSAYVETYLREEIQQEALTRNLDQFFRFLKVSAILNGQITNWSNIAREVGAARSTVVGYFEILQDTLVGWTLPAYRARAKVKEVSHPKFYWFDVGVLRALQGNIHDPVSEFEKGALLETFVCNEMRALNSLLGWNAELSYWRTEAGTEVDLILKRGKRAIGLEIKATPRWKSEYSSGLMTLLEAGIIDHGYGAFLGQFPEKQSKNMTVYPVERISEAVAEFFV